MCNVIGENKSFTIVGAVFFVMQMGECDKVL